MGKGSACASYTGGRGSYGVDGRSAYMTAMALSGGNAFKFYGSIQGLYEPTDGNIFVLPRMHGGAEFNPISRYEGKDEGQKTFNVGTTYQRGSSIDDTVFGNPRRTAASNPQRSDYFSTTNFMQYIH